MSGSLGKSTSKQSSRSKQDIWEPQKEYLTDLYGEAKGLYGSRDPSTQAGLDLQRGYAQSPELQRTIGGAQQALQFNLDPTQAGNNPYLQRAMQSAIRPLTQNYQENVLSGITDEAIRSGQSGSSRQGIAEGIAGRGYLDQIGDITSRMAYGDYGAGMDRMGRAIDQAGAVANLGMLPSGMMRDVGGEGYRDIERYRDIIGAPTTLSESYGSGRSRGFTSSGGIGG